MMKDIWYAIVDKIKTIRRSSIYSFYTTIIVGLVIHITVWVTHLVNHDSVSLLNNDLYNVQPFTEGKWLSSVLILLRGSFVSSGVSVPQALILIAFSSAFLVSILDIKNVTSGIAIGILMVSMPTVFCIFSYQGYSFFFALFLSILSVYIYVRCKHGFILGVLVCTLSLAIYQAYIGFTASILLGLCIISIFNANNTIKFLLKKGIGYIIFLGCSIGLYYLVLQVILRISNINLSSYRNINEMTNFSLGEIPNILGDTYEKVVLFFVKDEYGTGGFIVTFFFKMIIFLSIIMLIYIIVQSKLYKNVSKIILLAILLMLLPFSVHAIAILGMSANTHWIMMYPFVMIFVLVVKGWDYILPFARKKSMKILVLGILLSVLGITYEWSKSANFSYDRLRLAYENAFSASVQLAADIRANNEYNSNMEIAFVGNEEYPVFAKTIKYYERLDNFTGIEDASHVLHDNRDVASFLDIYVGLDFIPVDNTVAEELNKNVDVRRMNIYPSYGSIAVMDDILIVKLSEVE